MYIKRSDSLISIRPSDLYFLRSDGQFHQYFFMIRWSDPMIRQSNLVVGWSD